MRRCCPGTQSRPCLALLLCEGRLLWQHQGVAVVSSSLRQSGSFQTPICKVDQVPKGSSTSGAALARLQTAAWDRTDHTTFCQSCKSAKFLLTLRQQDELRLGARSETPPAQFKGLTATSQVTHLSELVESTPAAGGLWDHFRATQTGDHL